VERLPWPATIASTLLGVLLAWLIDRKAQR
jgi:F0F1-type ATP synthase assembly protein I